jgi:hypothetical protein
MESRHQVWYFSRSKLSLCSAGIVPRCSPRWVGNSLPDPIEKFFRKEPLRIPKVYQILQPLARPCFRVYCRDAEEFDKGGLTSLYNVALQDCVSSMVLCVMDDIVQ